MKVTDARDGHCSHSMCSSALASRLPMTTLLTQKSTRNRHCPLLARATRAFPPEEGMVAATSTPLKTSDSTYLNHQVHLCMRLFGPIFESLILATDLPRGIVPFECHDVISSFGKRLFEDFPKLDRAAVCASDRSLQLADQCFMYPSLPQACYRREAVVTATSPLFHFACADSCGSCCELSRPCPKRM